jgi:hypothetical protein
MKNVPTRTSRESGEGRTPGSSGALARTRMASEPNAISHGTIFSNTPDGPTSSNTPPTTPPATATALSRRTRSAWPVSSGREPATDPTLLKTRATVLVTLAVTGPSPTASSAG